MNLKKRILFVEGADDFHAIMAILKHYQVKQVFDVKIPDSEGKVNQKAISTELGGIHNVLKAVDVFLIDNSDSERIGIVIDADEDLNARWQSVVSILQKAGYTNENIPSSPIAEGTVINQDDLPIFGVWIMPDNQTQRGFLETFLTFLVDENDDSWKKAKSCVANLTNKPFVKPNTDHTIKAEIHTFLAWQEEPGKPFGQAITAKYLQAENPECEKFVNWLKRLFFE
jgi:hypothetical protein